MPKFESCLQEEFSVDGLAETPADINLFTVDEKSPALSAELSKKTHRGIQMLAWLGSRARPELLVALAFLKTRVCQLTEQDQVKFYRVVKYLKKYPNLRRRISANSDLNVYGFIDCSYGTYASGHSGTGTNITFGTGSIYADSSKQKIVTTSSTEGEFVGLSDKTKVILWIQQYLEDQRADGKPQPAATIYQDNQSTIQLAEKGRAISQRSRHINIRYFFVTDRIKSGEIKLEYKPTGEMVADVLTKPLQGALFRKFRTQLLGEWRCITRFTLKGCVGILAYLACVKVSLACI